MNCFQGVLSINGGRLAPGPREAETASPRL